MEAYLYALSCACFFFISILPIFSGFCILDSAGGIATISAAIYSVTVYFVISDYRKFYDSRSKFVIFLDFLLHHFYSMICIAVILALSKMEGEFFFQHLIAARFLAFAQHNENLELLMRLLLCSVFGILLSCCSAVFLTQMDFVGWMAGCMTSFKQFCLQPISRSKWQSDSQNLIYPREMLLKSRSLSQQSLMQLQHPRHETNFRHDLNLNSQQQKLNSDSQKQAFPSTEFSASQKSSDQFNINNQQPTNFVGNIADSAQNDVAKNNFTKISGQMPNIHGNIHGNNFVRAESYAEQPRSHIEQHKPASGTQPRAEFFSQSNQYVSDDQNNDNQIDGDEAVHAAHDVVPRKRYINPPLSILNSPPVEESNIIVEEESSCSQCAEKLTKVLADFGVKGHITTFHTGPVVTLYEFEPISGVKSSRIISLSDDIARSLCAQSARVSSIQGKTAIGIEIPNRKRALVTLREIIEYMCDEEEIDEMCLPIALGKTIGGDYFIGDLAKMPHLLIAGTTGSGKSVAINAMILSIIYRFSPYKCKMIMIDPKVLELSVYNDIPHLLTPVVTDPSMAVAALKWVTKQMESRYKMMAKVGARNIIAYNQWLEEEGSGSELYQENIMPYIVVVVDEMADLMVVAGKAIESSVQRLSQMARAAGIHIIMATQRPSVDVITGVIKANFPTRISFAVSSKFDSRTILGEQGAEQLLGMGDMLYMRGGCKISRLHGPFISDQEVAKTVDFIKSHWGKPEYNVDFAPEDEIEPEESISLPRGSSSEMSAIEYNNMSDEELYVHALDIVISKKRPTASYLQREMRIGYNKASRLIETMEKRGILSPPDPNGRRVIYQQSVDDSNDLE